MVESLYSNIAHPESSGSVTYETIPADPTNLIAYLVEMQKVVYLHWTSNSSNEQGFEIERKVDSGLWSLLYVVGPGTQNFQDSTVDSVHTYYYRVRAFNVIGYSDYTNTASVLCNVPSGNPSSLTATAVSDQSISLSWTGVANAGAYDIQRSTDQFSNFAHLDSTNQPTTTFVDNTCLADTTYYYRVTARNAFGTSGYSNTANAHTWLLANPTNLTIYDVYANSATIDWDYTHTTETSFDIERKIGVGGTWTFLVNVSYAQTYYDDSGLLEFTDYYYRVKAKNSSGYSGWSNETHDVTMLNTPTSLTGNVEPATEGTKVNLDWIDNSTHELNYVIERSTVGDTGPFIVRSTQPASTVYYQDTTLGSTDYWYRVKATNATKQSAYSNVFHILTTAKPPAPTNLVASESAYPNQGVVLTWEDNSSDELYFEIERSSGGITYSWTVPANTLTTVDTNVVVNGSYTYRIRAYNNDFSDWSNNAVITCTYEANPTDLVATASSDTTIHLTWVDHATSEANYEIYRSDTGSPGDYTKIDTIDANSEEYDDTPPEGVDWYYMVAAANWIGSAFSNADHASVLLGRPEITTIDLTGTNFRTVFLEITCGSDHQDTIVLQRRIKTTGTWADIDSHTESGLHIGDFVQFEDNGTTAHLWYEYRAKATSPTNYSNWSDVVEVKAIGYPTAPSGLDGYTEYISGYGGVLTWTDESTTEDGFSIEQKIDSGLWSELEEIVIPDTEEYEDQGVGYTEGSTVYYRVKSFERWNGHTLYSTPSSETSFVWDIAQSTDLTGSTVNTTTIHLEWTDNYQNTHSPTNQDGVTYQYTTDPPGGSRDWTENNLSGQLIYQTECDIDGLVAATLYYLRVKPYIPAMQASINDNTPWSNEISIGTQLLAVSDLIASGYSTTTIDLSWTPFVLSGVYYHVQKSSVGDTGPWIDVDDTDIGDSTYQVTGLDSGTRYWFRIQSRKSGWMSSAYSNVVNELTSLEAPTDFEGYQWRDYIYWTWIPHSTTQDDFLIHWDHYYPNGVWYSFEEMGYPGPTSANQGPGWYTLGENAWAIIWIKARKDGRLSDKSNEIKIVNNILWPFVTATPNGSTENLISITNQSLVSTGLKLYRSDDGETGTYNLIHTFTSPDNVLNYPDSGLDAETTYWYKAKAYNTERDGEFSDPASATTALAAPSDFTALLNEIDTNCYTTWNLNSTTEDGVIVHCDFYYANGDFASSYESSQLDPGTEELSFDYAWDSYGENAYELFYVQVIKGGLRSDKSNTVRVDNHLKIPSIAAYTVGTTVIGVNITNYSSVATGLKLYRSATETGTYVLIHTFTSPDHVYGYEDTGLDAETPYWYKATSYTTTKESPKSTAVSATTGLAAPSDLVVTISDDETTSYWDWILHSTTEDYVYILTEGYWEDDTKWIAGAYNLANGTEEYEWGGGYWNNGGENGYWKFSVQALKDGIYSDKSNIVTIQNTLIRVSSVYTTVLGSTSIRVHFANGSPTATNFRIYRSSTETGTYTEVGTGSLPATYWDNTGLDPNTTYWYKVTVYNSSKESRKSNAASGTTNP